MEKSGNIDELELLEQLRKRDDAAFATAYNLYWPVMYNHALRMLGDEEDARDIVQELFITFHDNLEKLSENTHIAGYLFIILRNKILNLIRRQRVRYDYLDMMQSFSESGGNNVSETLNAKELQQALDAELQKMPARMREIFELSRNEYLTHKEIAAKLNLSDKTVKTQVNNALRILRIKLQVSIIAIPALYLLLKSLS